MLGSHAASAASAARAVSAREIGVERDAMGRSSEARGLRTCDSVGPQAIWRATPKRLPCVTSIFAAGDERSVRILKLVDQHLAKVVAAREVDEVPSSV